MKIQISKLLVVLMLISPLAACQNQQTGQGGLTKETGGTLVGGAAGALVGSQFGKGRGQLVGVAAGTLLGAYLGNQVGASLDKADMTYYNQTSQTALENNRVGQPSTWRNPDSGAYGSVTPTRTYQTASNEQCREYNQTVTVGGKTEKAYGTACRQPDGSWRIIQ